MPREQTQCPKQYCLSPHDHHLQRRYSEEVRNPASTVCHFNHNLSVLPFEIIFMDAFFMCLAPLLCYLCCVTGPNAS